MKKKSLLAAAMLLGGLLGANAVVWLPNPVITEETVADNGVTVSWTYDSSEEPCTHFQVIVYKMHKADKAETFTLAQTDFDYITSTGTMSKKEDRGAIWDYIPECPGWWVKYPLYMNGAMGVDTFMYFAGSDNADIFGGAYIISPDYDLTHLANPSIKIETELGNEATSVTGGFALWAWNTNWYDPKNIDYKPVYGNDHHFTDLASTSWASKSETLVFPDVADYTDPDQIEEIESIDKSRTRVMFYGQGYSAYWVNGFKLTVDMAAGDMVDYGAAIHEVTGNTFTIDTSADTPNDYTYAYEVRPVKLDYDDYRDVTTIRFTNYAYSSPRHVIGQLSGIDDITAADQNVKIYARDGQIIIEGADDSNASVYNVAGQCVYTGAANVPVTLDRGVYIVTAGATKAKVAL